MFKIKILILITAIIAISEEAALGVNVDTERPPSGEYLPYYFKISSLARTVLIFINIIDIFVIRR